VDRKKHRSVFRRVKTTVPYLLFGGVALFMFCAAIDSLTGRFTTWKLPVWKMDLGGALFVTVFMLLWLGFVGSFARLFFLALETVEVTREAVRIKIGPLVIRRMDLDCIKTVIRTGDEHPPYPTDVLGFGMPYDSNQKYSTWKLVLSSIQAEELREMSLSLEQKRLQKRQMQRMGNKEKDAARRIKRYMRRNFLKNRFWLEYSEEAEEALRKYLTTTVFIV
jgi:hypothetical protein